MYIRLYLSIYIVFCLFFYFPSPHWNISFIPTSRMGPGI